MKIIHVAGKRKTAVAKATLKPGKGRVRINNTMLDVYEPSLVRQRLREPIMLAGDLVDSIDISVRVTGGGQGSQAEAGRLAIARALAKHSKKLEEVFSKYDRHLLVADVRRKEPSKPNCQGKARSKRQKSYR